MDTLNAESEKVLAIAREEAAGLRHEFTGTEHLLLGLLACDDEIAAPLLGKHGIVAVEVRAQLARPGAAADRSSERARALTARAKQVLTLARQEAEALEENEVGPEHLLLGIIRQASGVAALLLRDMGVDLTELRDEVLEARGERDRLFAAAAAPPSADSIAAPAASEVLEGSAGEASPALARLPAAPPLCPGCGQRLTEVLALATVVPAGSNPSGRRRGLGAVTLVYCGACGHTLSATR